MDDTWAGEAHHSDDNNSDSPSDSSSSCSAHEEQLQQKHGQRHIDFDLCEPLYQHRKSRMLHRPHKSGGLLLCGRRAGDGYNFLEHGASFKWPRCSHCFKGEVISSVPDLIQALDEAHSSRLRGEASG